MAKDMAGSYHRTTSYLTDEQWRWLSRLATQARLDDLQLSASDVIRLAVTRSHDQLSIKELRKALIAHVRSEAERYQDERDVACPKARPNLDVMLVRRFSTSSRPALRAASGRPRRRSS